MSLVPVLRAGAVGALLLLAGCATRAPALQDLAGVGVPAQWAQPAAAGDATLARWWSAFGDATLVSLVEEALRGNTDIAVARANVRQARALRDQAAAALRPTLGLTASAARNQPAGGSGRNNLQAGLDAGWEADLFGGNRHGVAAQDALLQAGSANLGATQVSVAAEVALSYLDLLNAQARTAVARENLALQEETLQISRWRQQAGLANSVEVEQALATVEQTRAQVPALQAATARAAHALGVLVGQPPETLLARLSVVAAVPQPRQALAVAIPAVTLRQRPDVLAAESQLRAAAEQVASAERSASRR
jgi:NodT family efflux transporter outer membrane factor (OMF) lipoprotein